MLSAVDVALEAQVQDLHRAGDLHEAASVAMKGYGPAVYGLLLSLHRDEAAAGEVFSTFSEDLWKGMRSFRWGCTLRTWVYALAHNASRRQFRGVARERGQVPISEAARNLAERIRTETRTWMRTQTKDWFAKIRESLPPDDQVLLVLRVDRELGWDELARVSLGDPEADGAAVKRESMRLRKRFQLLKDQLRDMAARDGILGAHDA
jgi:RNA polymerase sigma-70 factor (ECF subfamily)